jgi:hypothetical protein
VEIEPAVFESALSGWERSQQADGGWGYGKESLAGDATYGSMTAGGVASLILTRDALQKPWRGDPRITRGLAWLKTNWSAHEHPGYPDPQLWVQYYFYAVERLGDLMGEETLGGQEWYAPIRDFLISSQKRDGSWIGSDELSVADTCFAILFLRRATIPLHNVATEK